MRQQLQASKSVSFQVESINLVDSQLEFHCKSLRNSIYNFSSRRRLQNEVEVTESRDKSNRWCFHEFSHNFYFWSLMSLNWYRELQSQGVLNVTKWILELDMRNNIKRVAISCCLITWRHWNGSWFDNEKVHRFSLRFNLHDVLNLEVPLLHITASYKAT